MTYAEYDAIVTQGRARIEAEQAPVPALARLALRILARTSPFSKAEVAAARLAYLRATGRQA